jgi:hypothetical protein
MEPLLQKSHRQLHQISMDRIRQVKNHLGQL